ncbi:MAG: SDR family oxidoreductase [Dehalococcoidia bacterium]|jgi:NAD(P)-dependent dehydrogenase (short-subunit alcohol dehydrogenase family)|nr:SDR family oxidoreductase [Dehalococcoidia bacterium]
MLEKLSMDDKVVVVTGGGTGIGLAMVRHLARAGAHVSIGGRRSGPIEDAAAEVKALGRDALAISTDVSDSSQVDRLINTTLEHFSHIDVMINNAGAVQDNVRKAIWDHRDKDWHRVMDVNLSGAFYCSRAVSRPMADRGKGKIINIASSYGMRGGRDIYMYCCSKGGMVQLTRVLAFNLARYGITANSISPGYIPTVIEYTDMRSTAPPSADWLPTGKMSRPEDIGPIAVFLASEASDYMTGEMIIVDGGCMTAGVIPTGHAPLVPLED